MKKLSSLFLASCLLFMGCIGDDLVFDRVDPELRITSNIDTMKIGTTRLFEHMYLNNVGAEEMINPTWSSSDERIIAISTAGLAEALQEGSSQISVMYQTDGMTLQADRIVHVGQNESSSSEAIEGVIKTTSSYQLEGDFTLSETENGVLLELGANYRASTALPGLYVYLSNNRNSISNAMEIAKVSVFSGAHSYDISGASISDYSYVLYFCKPFNVKVGDGQIQ